MHAQIKAVLHTPMSHGSIRVTPCHVLSLLSSSSSQNIVLSPLTRISMHPFDSQPPLGDENNHTWQRHTRYWKGKQHTVLIYNVSVVRDWKAINENIPYWKHSNNPLEMNGFFRGGRMEAVKRQASGPQIVSLRDKSCESSFRQRRHARPGTHRPLSQINCQP